MNNSFYGPILIISFLLGGCGQVRTGQTNTHPKVVQTKAATDTLIRKIKPPRHVVIVIEENHSYAEIMGSKAAPYIHSLMHQGASFTNYHGVEHPSQPNYLDLFSGSNQGVTSDSCPHTFSTPNLAGALMSAKLSFVGYAEDLPSTGYEGCSSGGFWPLNHGAYARKHNPWVNFTNIPSTINMPFASFPKDFQQLPTVSFVVPNLNHDMHNGSIAAGDMWLKQHMDGYVQWAKANDSLLIVTWDEDDNSDSNQIPTIFVGPMVKPGAYSVRYNHFNLLRTLEDIYHLQYLGESKSVPPMTGIWKSET